MIAVTPRAVSRRWRISRRGGGSIHVRFGPKADKLLRRSECPLSARSGNEALSQKPLSQKDVPPVGGGFTIVFNPVSLRAPRTTRGRVPRKRDAHRADRGPDASRRAAPATSGSH